MKHSKFIKGLVLLSFIFFIGIFLLYRMGKFDGYLSNKKSSSQNSKTEIVNSNKSDTPQTTITDSAQNLIMSSSKVIILPKETEYLVDSLQPKTKSDSLRNKKTVIMSGSKSGKVFLELPVDNLKSDTSKHKKEKE